MAVTRQDFRDAMARLGAAVTIVATDGPAGRAGFTASAVASVTDDPPTLLVCMNRAVSGAPALRANGVISVNVLAAPHAELAQIFAGATGRPNPERFEAAAWTSLATGAPILEDALIAFDCRVADLIEKGTHTVVFAEIAGIRPGPAGPALIWFARGFRTVPHHSP